MTTLSAVAIIERAEAERQRVRAEEKTETAQQTTNFMIELFAVSDPSEALGNTITAREILDQGARRIEFELVDQPAIQSTLLDTMGAHMRIFSRCNVAGLPKTESRLAVAPYRSSIKRFSSVAANSAGTRCSLLIRCRLIYTH